jgi:hypothetical protein
MVNHTSQQLHQLLELVQTWNVFGVDSLMHETIGEGPFAVLLVSIYLFVGWPAYVFGIAATGRVAYDGTPLKNSR